jgi:hypothetical protein
MEFIRPTMDLIERGLFVELNAYKYYVFVDFRQVQDDAFHSYRRLCDYLGGRGVPSVQDALRELFLQPVQQPFREIANAGYINYLLENRLSDKRTSSSAKLLAEAEAKINDLFAGIETLHGKLLDTRGSRQDIVTRLQAVLSLSALTQAYPLPGSRRYAAGASMLMLDLHDHPERWFTLLGWVFTHKLGALIDAQDSCDRSLSLLDEWQLNRVLASAWKECGLEPEQIEQQSAVLRLLIAQQDWYTRLGTLPADKILESWLSDTAVQRYLGINRYQGILWFNREAFDTLVWWMGLLAVLDACDRRGISAAALAERIIHNQELTLQLVTASAGSQYQVEKLLANVKVSINALAKPEKNRTSTASTKKTTGKSTR